MTQKYVDPTYFAEDYIEDTDGVGTTQNYVDPTYFAEDYIENAESTPAATPAANCLLAFPDYTQVSASYSPTLSGGSWLTALPLTNLQDRSLAKVARSSNALAAATTFDVDLKTARSIRVIALLRHTCSAEATVQVMGSTVADFATTVYDSGAVAVWPEGYPATEDRLGYQADFYLPLTADQTARYWRVSFVDTANAAGHLDLGRCCLMAAWQPAMNMVYGATLGLETDTTLERSLGGTPWFDRREPRRHQQFTLAHLLETEAFQNAFRMLWRLGIDGELLFCHNPGDTGERLKQRSFLATLRQLSVLEYPYVNYHKMAFEVVEKV